MTRAVAARRWLAAHADLVAVSAVVAVALYVRFGFAFRVAPFIAKDSQAYFLPAWDLIHTGDFELGLRRTPGYPAFLALGLLVVGDDLRGLTLLQHLLGVGTVVLAYWLGRLTFGRPAGLIAGLVASVSAPLLVYEHYLLTEPVFTFALTAALVAIALAWRGALPRPWLIAGLLVGLAAMVKPIGQATLPVALLAALVAKITVRDVAASLRSSAGVRALLPRLTAAGLVLVGFAIAIAPWTIRNQITHNVAAPSTFGRTLIARTASYDRGFTFYDAANPPASQDPDRVRARRIVQQGSDRGQSDGTIAQRLRQELDLGPVEVNALMRDLAVEAIVRQPLYFVEGSFQFALRIFHGVDMRIREHENEKRDVEWERRTEHLLRFPADAEDDFRAASRMLSWLQPSQLAPIPFILFGVGSLAALLVPAWRPGLVPAMTALALIGASATLNGPQERYRYPVDPAIYVVASGGCLALVQLLRAIGSQLAGRAEARSSRRGAYAARVTGESRTGTAQPSPGRGAAR